MKKYLKEVIIFLVQLLGFYILPLFAGPTDAMGLVVLLLMGTALLSLILGIISNSELKYVYPFATAIVFIPTVFIYYNYTAIVHSTWYMVVSLVCLLIGTVINLIFKKLRQKQ